MALVKDHTHKFKRYRYKNGSAVYFCANGDCTFKLMPQMALGKICECWRCGRQFNMDEYSIRLSKPHCKACRKVKTDNIISEIQPLIAESSVDDLSERLSEAIGEVDDKDI